MRLKPSTPPDPAHARGLRRWFQGPVTATILVAAVASAFSVFGGAAQAEAQVPVAVTGLAPNFGSTSGGTTVTIVGTHLAQTTAVRFGTKYVRFVVDSSTEITVSSPAKGAGTVDIRVDTKVGRSPRTQADEFTFVDQPPRTVQIDPEYPDYSCAGNQDLATWTPPSGVSGLTGFFVLIQQFYDSGPVVRTFTLGPDQSSVPFTVINGETTVLVFTITAAGVARRPFGGATQTGLGVPLAMSWNNTGANSVADGSATVSFIWGGPPQATETGGDVADDTVEVTASRGAGTEDVPASVDGVTANFAGLTDGTAYTISDTVSNVCGTSSSQFAPEFTPGVPPSISGTPGTGQVGDPYSYSLAVAGDPAPALSLTQGALPPGLSLAGDGTISGTPTTPGTYDATVTATNDVGIQDISSGQASESFPIEITEAPTITSSPAATFTVGEQSSFDVTATGYPAPEISETGSMPEGLVFDIQPGGTATISGTPAPGTGGVYPITITASNGIEPDAVQYFVLTVAPTITSAPSATTLAGAPFSFTVTTAGLPVASITKSGSLPTGLHFTDDRNGTATISGTPGARSGGVYPLTITATFGTGSSAQTAVQQLTLTVDQPLAITSPAWVKAYVGETFGFTVKTVGFPGATDITEVGALPDGLTFTYDGGSTATISGEAVPGTEAVYSLDIEATNDAGGSAGQTLTLVVKS
jgi:hypothetical protein